MAAGRPADQAVRERALAPEESFIVQAPAGSGKTGLLTQRLLRLLARAEHPEEVLAITFTRKAAAEMRARVLAALRDAADGVAAEGAYRRTTAELAGKALARDREAGWELLGNPRRLRIQTIDALCAELTRMMPVASGFGTLPALTEDVRPLYEEAALRTLAELEAGDDWSAPVEHLLGYLDNDLPKAVGLLADMLASRDHWLRHVADRSDPRIQRPALERALRRVIERGLEAAARSIPVELVPELCALAAGAAERLQALGSESELVRLRGLESLPGTGVEERGRWEALVELLLTRNGDWRRSVSVAIGFEAPSGAPDATEKERRADAKRRFLALLGRLQEAEAPGRALGALRALPPDGYTDAQWQLLEALARLLPLAVAQLDLVLGERSCCDFPGLAQAAVRALGEPEAPSDLALALDYRIRHILVDEFQDTSLRQLQLLERLTAGWTPGDGRTLFLVGDPMQSIYRFREAEVGLYLRAREQGVGSVALTPLALSANFRSRPALVEWVNATFASILPGRDDLARGAVAYAAAEAECEAIADSGVELHASTGDVAGEAEQVAGLVSQARAADPGGEVAILVRTRGHAADIAAALRRRGISYQAVELEALAARPEVGDLVALTRALLHPADAVAWLAVLRAPWCGLELHDLHALMAQAPRGALVWERLRDPALLAALSPAGQAAVARVTAVLEAAIGERARMPLRRWVERAWLGLGGPATLSQPVELENARAYLDLLEGAEAAGGIASVPDLERRLADLYARSDREADPGVQIMTMHKAKGLEFDTVILPGLDRSTRGDPEKLLLWLELPDEAGEEHLLLAPLKGRQREDDGLYAAIRELDRERDGYERGRLLYVAATRARERLHLIARLGLDADGQPKKPSRRSLLAELWPAVAGDCLAALEPQVDSAPGASQDATPVRLRRLPAGWRLPAPPPAAPWVGPASALLPESGAGVEFDWAGESARCVGVVVHRLLQHVARDGPDAWTGERVAALAPAVSAALGGLGLAEPELPLAARQVLAALEGALADPRGRWILDSGHAQAASELELCGVLDGQRVRVAIDRTFVDAEGVRWIIDYKTGGHEGGERERFLDAEQARYREQLERYARVLERGGERRIRLGLYFPLLGGWREWGYDGDGEG